MNLLFALILSFVFTLSAHAAPAWGPVGGLTLGNGTFSVPGYTTSLKNRVGVAAGISTEFELGDVFFLQPELLYVSKGATLTVLMVDTDFSFDYVELPVFIKPKFAIGSGSAKAYALVGPSFGVMTKASATVSGLGAGATITDVERFEFSGNLGAGLEGAVGNFIGFLDLRYMHGFSNIVKNNLNGRLSYSNRTWLILVGAHFGM
ncbi:MAG TPA: porin family protein [Bdellovibrionota bacterium]|jgi:hypothetical protein